MSLDMAERFGNLPACDHCGCNSMAECELPKLNTGVRFPSPAPLQKSPSLLGFFVFMGRCGCRALTHSPRFTRVPRCCYPKRSVESRTRRMPSTKNGNRDSPSWGLSLPKMTGSPLRAMGSMIDGSSRRRSAEASANWDCPLLSGAWRKFHVCSKAPSNAGQAIQSGCPSPHRRACHASDAKE